MLQWPTDSNGIVEFTGIVPGFYVERTLVIPFPEL